MSLFFISYDILLITSYCISIKKNILHFDISQYFCTFAAELYLYINVVYI